MKKILILSCHGGGGHTSAAQAITQMLKKNYVVETVDVTGKELAYIDPIYWLSFKKYSGQDLYNFLLRTNNKWLANFFSHLGSVLIRINSKWLIRGFKKLFLQRKPDLIISVIPLLNKQASVAADRVNIPLLIIPTDLDVRTFINNLPVPMKGQVQIGLAFDYSIINEFIRKKILNAYPIKYIGFPIKPGFWEEKNKPRIKLMYGIETNCPVIMVIMGATGSVAIKKYVELILSMNISLQLIVCIGRAAYLKKVLESLHVPNHMMMLVVDDSADVSDLMAITDICITKPGSVTFAEILYKHIPVLIDNTTQALIWERLNLTFTLEHKIGYVIKEYAQVITILKYLLLNPQALHNIKSRYARLKQPLIAQHIEPLVKCMVENA